MGRRRRLGFSFSLLLGVLAYLGCAAIPVGNPVESFANVARIASFTPRIWRS